MTKSRWTMLAILGLGVAFVFACLGGLIAGMVFAPSPKSAPVVIERVITTTPETVLSIATRSPTSSITFDSDIPKRVPTQTPSPSKGKTQDVLLQDHRCVGYKFEILCYVTVKNGRNIPLSNAHIDLNTFDPSGISLGGTFELVTNLYPGETRKVFFTTSLNGDNGLGGYSIALDTWELGGAGSQLPVSPFSIASYELQQRGISSDQVIVIVANSSDKTIENAFVDVVLFDKNGEFVGGGSGGAPILPPRGKSRAEIAVHRFGEIAKIEVYPYFSILYKIK